jgi:hypothetical protein
MTTSSVQTKAVPATGESLLRLATLAPRPRTMADTGLSRNTLEELLVKHLYDAGVLDLQTLVKRTALAGPVLEEILAWKFVASRN